ncbi:MAG: lipid A-modifier LpxR family protein [Pseudooceanicola sp.]
MRRFLAALSICLAIAPPLMAEERQFLGHGRLIDNDDFADFRDRWQTGSVAASYAWGPAWTGRPPSRPGQLLEFRILGRIIAPSRLDRVDRRDRPYANALSLGLHTHFDWDGLDVALGGDVVITGDQTGIYRIQQALHDTFGFDGPSDAVRAAGIGNGVHGAAVVEIGQEVSLGRARLRPFVEARYGVEALARFGADLTFGGAGRGGLLVRDPVTGQRYQVVKSEPAGFSYVLGADFAAVTESIYLPEPAHDPLNRLRLRAGVHWEGERARLFYGVTWLSREFAGQPNGQLVGSLRIDYDF